MECDFVAKGETEEDIMRQSAEHARSAHNMNEIPPEVVDRGRRLTFSRATRSILRVKEHIVAKQGLNSL